MSQRCLLYTSVMDIVENEIRTLILDASAACHMPDVLEMPYRPPLKDSGEAGEKAYTCLLYTSTIGKKFAKVVDTVEPDPELVAKYEERYQKFRTLYPAMKPLF